MKRLFKILAFIAVIYGVAIYGGFAPMPFKVTDPSDPRFNINRFRFEDYPTPKGLRTAVEKMFPTGTDLEEIDRVLVEIGGAEKSPISQIPAHRLKYYENPELYRVYRYFKITWVGMFLQKVVPAPGRADRLVTVEIDSNDKSVFVLVYR